VYPFERFTEDAKQALTFAQDESERAGHGYIGTEHVLIGLTRADGRARTVLESFGVDARSTRAGVADVAGGMTIGAAGHVIPTSQVKRAIELAFVEARSVSSDVVGGEHLLVGILLEGQSLGAQVLQQAGANLELVRERLGMDADLESVTLRTHDFSIYGGRETGAVHKWHAVSAAPAVGARVLVHDPAPPYRMWEGTVIERGNSDVTVNIPGHPNDERVVASLDRIHPLPPRVMRCPYCEPEAWSLAVPAE